MSDYKADLARFLDAWEQVQRDMQAQERLQELPCWREIAMRIPTIDHRIARDGRAVDHFPRGADFLGQRDRGLCAAPRRSG